MSVDQRVAEHDRSVLSSRAGVTATDARAVADVSPAGAADADVSGAVATDAADPGAPKPETDGRLLRSERTKLAIVEALLELIREGDVRPSSACIAEKAGVTQRTLFNQFGDMKTLFAAAARRHTQRVASLLPAAVPGDRQTRVDHFSDQLARLLEEVMNIRWSVMTSAEGRARYGESLMLFNAAIRHQLGTAFDEELSQLPEADRSAVLDLLEIEGDPLTWRLRRVQQGRSFEEATALLRRAIDAQLGSQPDT